jgi:hypothetical protein
MRVYAHSCKDIKTDAVNDLARQRFTPEPEAGEVAVVPTVPGKA